MYELVSRKTYTPSKQNLSYLDISNRIVGNQQVIKYQNSLASKSKKPCTSHTTLYI